MNIEQLIIELKKYPPKFRVVFLDNDQRWSGQIGTHINLIEIWDMDKTIQVPAVHIRGVADDER